MKTKICLLAAAMILLAGARALAEPAEAEIAEAKGAVKVISPDGRTLDAEAGMKLAEGWQVKVGLNSSAVLTWGEGNIAALTNFTSLRIDKLQLEKASGKSETRLYLSRGNAFAHAAKVKESDSHFSVKTPTATAGVRGTDLGVQVDGRGRTRISTFSGEVEAASAEGSTAIVEPGHTAVVDEEGQLGSVEPISREQATGMMQEMNGFGQSQGAGAGAFANQLQEYLRRGIENGGFDNVEFPEVKAEQSALTNEYGKEQVNSTAAPVESGANELQEGGPAPAGASDVGAKLPAPAETAAAPVGAAALDAAAGAVDTLYPSNAVLNDQNLQNTVLDQVLVESSEILNQGF